MMSRIEHLCMDDPSEYSESDCLMHQTCDVLTRLKTAASTSQNYMVVGGLIVCEWTAHIHDVKTGTLVHEIGDDVRVNCLAFSNHSGLLAICWKSLVEI